MATLTLRNVKGSPLTNTEVDNNFSSLDNAKTEKTANLSDLSDPASARQNIDVPSTTEALNTAIAMSIALG